MKKLVSLFIILCLAKGILSQNIGIGTTMPGAKLQINHKALANTPSIMLFDSTGGAGSEIRFVRQGVAITNNFAIHAGFTGVNSTSYLRMMATSGQPGITMNGNGHVVVGGGTPNFVGTFNVQGSANFTDNILMNGDAGQVGQPLVSNSEDFGAPAWYPNAYFTANGRVGINQSTPLEALHVSGNIKSDTVKPSAIKFTPNAGKNKILTSDSSGDASWQNLNTVSGSNLGLGTWGDCANSANISEYYPVSTDSSFGLGFFGYSVSISGNYAAVGQPKANSNRGKVQIYHFNGTVWEHLQELRDIASASDAGFGFSVAMSGNNLIIGAPFDDVGVNTNQGYAYIYRLSGGLWVLSEKISDPIGASNDNFGYSVSISGNLAIVGSPFDDVGVNTNQGSVSFFRNTVSNFWNHILKATDASGLANDKFGFSVSLSGNSAIVGAPLNDNNSATDNGTALTYHYNGTTFVFTDRFNGSGSGSQFGYSVSVAGEYAVVGSPFRDLSLGADKGEVGIYRQSVSGGTWGQVMNIADEANVPLNFGFSVNISGNYIVVGSFESSVLTVYQKIGYRWLKLQNIKNPAQNQFDYFGISAAVDGVSRRFLVGSPNGSVNLNGSFPGNISENFQGTAVFGKIN